MRKFLTITLATVALAAASHAATVTPAWEWDSDTTQFTNGSWVFGVNFQVNASNIAVSALGYYDSNGDGFSSSHPVGLYDSLGALLASATITSSDTLIGHFRYVSISPVTLLANTQYRMVGVSINDTYTWGPQNFQADPAVTFLGDSYDSGSSLVDPVGQFNDDASFHGFFGPGFQIGDPAPAGAVPEPSSYILCAAGTAVLALARRKLQR